MCSTGPVYWPSATVGPCTREHEKQEEKKKEARTGYNVTSLL